MSRALRISLILGLSLTVLTSLIPRSAVAGATDPVLAIGQVVVKPAGTGSFARISGTWEFDNILQVDFPMSLVAYQGTSFVRFRVDGTVVSGSLPGLADGFDTGDVAALEATGTNEPGGALVRLDANEIVVALPGSIVDGDVSFVAYVELPAEGTFISNTITTLLLGAGL